MSDGSRVHPAQEQKPAPNGPNDTTRVDQQVMRAVNRGLIENLFRSGDRLSRAEVAKLTGLAKPTVSAIIAELMTDGVLREVGMGATTAAGRPPMLLEYDVRREFLAGVSLELEVVKVLIADSRGDTVAEIDHPRSSKGDPLVPIATAVERGLEDAGAPRSALTAVGVSIPGMVDLSTGICLQAPRIGWVNVPVRRGLEELLQVPVFPLNTTQAAVVAEAEEGSAAGASDVVLYYMGVGIGAGVLLGGRVAHGHLGMTGEIGHCAVPGAHGLCACGKRGCLETVAGIDAILQAAGVPVDHDPEAALARVIAAAEAGSGKASKSLAEAGSALGLAASWLVNLYNPEVLVLTGPLADAGDHLLVPLRRELFQDALPGHGSQLKIVNSTLGASALRRGAVLLARQRATAHYRVVFGSA